MSETVSFRDRPLRTKEHTMCRMCGAQCSLIVEMESGRPVKLYGDKNNPISHGFSCIKGRNFAEFHSLPSRLTRSMKRVGDTFVPISSEDAIQEIGDKLKAIIAESGPRAVAGFAGTIAYYNPLSFSFFQYFLDAIGSPMMFNSWMIDQPGKTIAHALMGPWLAGWRRNPQELDVALLIGHNPLISIGGAFGVSPAHNLVEARKRGLKLIVADPRRTETANHADLFLQVRPGEDATLLAGLVQVVLDEELYDKAFVAEETSGLDELRAAVAPYTPEYVASRVDLAADDMRAAARMFAGGRSGFINIGTGPNMAGRGNLTEYLGRVLISFCGHWPRAGEKVGNPGVLFNYATPPMAATPGPMPAWGFGEKLRVHGLTNTASGMPTAALPDEILTPGEGKVRALIVLGGNPMLVFPDQEKTNRALQHLDLLVCIDPKISATAEVGDYVIAPKMPLETPSISSMMEWLGTWGIMVGYDIPYAQYTPPLLKPPPGSDIIDEWRFFHRLAASMDLQMRLKPASYSDPAQAEAHAVDLDMHRPYTTEEILELTFTGSPIPFKEVMEKAHGAGHVFDVPPMVIQPKPEGWTGRLQIAHPTMMAELAEVAAETSSRPHDPEFPYLLLSRRMRDHLNSNWQDMEALKREHRTNPAFMHPEDMALLNLISGDVVEIESDAGKIQGIVEPAPELRRGCVSMSHGWGTRPGQEDDPRTRGGCTGRLISTDRNCDPYTWLPRQSAIPVKVRGSNH